MPLDFPDNPTDNQEFNGYIYDATRGVWDVKLASDPLGSISLTTPAQGEVLSFDGTNWANQELQITSTIQDLTDTTISSPSEGDIMVYDGSSWINTPATSGNAIINGDFGIWQRGTSFTGGNVYMADRFRAAFQGSTGTATRESFTPSDIEAVGYGDAKYFARMDLTTSTNFTGPQQRVEDVRTFAGQTVTFSFWAKGTNPSSGSLSVNMLQSFGSGGSSNLSATPQPISLTANWQRFVLTFPVPSVSGKTIGSGSYLQVAVSSGSDSSTDAWTIDTWGWQLEAGSVATPFRLAGGGSKAAELALCQRYYQKSGNSPGSEWYPGIPDNASHDKVVAESMYGNADRAMTSITFPVRMRVDPTVSYYPARSAVSNTVSRLTVYNANTLVSFSSAAASGVSGIQGHFTGTSTDGTMYTYQYTADAEL